MSQREEKSYLKVTGNVQLVDIEKAAWVKRTSFEEKGNTQTIPDREVVFPRGTGL